MTNFLPKVLLSKLIAGMRGREVLVKALDVYLHNRLAYGSPIVNAHFPLFAAQVDQGDIARFECASAIGSFGNTAYTSSWTVFHIFSDAKLLADIRAQVSSITSTMTSDEGKTVNRIDLRKLRSETVVFSTVEEVSRYRATGVGIRYITENTVIGEGNTRYSLKKGGWILIANRALHSDKEQWGDDADTFVASRFTRKTPHLSFRGFGNGASACCGKNLALYHIASFVAILVMKYDITPVGGVWTEPGQDGRNTAAQVAGPIKKLMVRMTPREDAARVRWEYGY
jgi:cytochrome P450